MKQIWLHATRILITTPLILSLTACASSGGNWNLAGLWQDDAPPAVTKPIAQTKNPFLAGLNDKEIESVSAEAWRFYGNDWPAIAERSRFVRASMLASLNAAGAPEYLQIVPVVESGYDPYARSSVGATGLWQLMPATARDLGIHNKHGLDGRRDIERSTRAAARFLMQQHRRFGNWPLAFAAYHLGPNAVQKRINKRPWQPSDGLASMPLPPITKTYVRHLIGLIARQQEGLLDFPTPYPTETVAVNMPVDLAQLHTRAGLPRNQLYRFNPKLALEQYFDHSGGKLTLRVSARRVPTLNRALTAKHGARSLRIHVSKGDRLVDVARRYQVSITALRSSNPKAPMLFKKASELSIPARFLDQAAATPNPLVRDQANQVLAMNK